MNFVFVDETGDPGKQGSEFFGVALLQVHSDNYKTIGNLLATYQLLSGMFAEVKELPQKYIVGLNLVRSIASFAEVGLIEASGLYIDKNRYGGRYLTWSDPEYDIPKKDWPYYLRNYLLRHLLEFHFAQNLASDDEVDLILDRILLTEEQRVNTLSYLNSHTPIPLRQPFTIPHVKHLTIADSKYIGSLQIVHLLAELMKSCAKSKVHEEQSVLIKKFFRIVTFIGHKKPS